MPVKRPPMWFVRLSPAKSLLLAFVVMVILAEPTAHPWDIHVWILTGQDIIAGVNPYRQTVEMAGYVQQVYGLAYFEGYAYPPLWAYVCTLIMSAVLFLGQYGVEADLLTIFLIKLPIILGTVACGWLIYKILLELVKEDEIRIRLLKTEVQLTRQEVAKLGMMAWIFNPYVLVVSAMWGAFDALVGLCLLLAAKSYRMNKPLLTGACVGLGVALKSIPILLIPSYLIVTRASHRRGWVRFLFASLAIVFAVCAPFLIWDLNAFVSVVIGFHLGRGAGGVSWYQGFNLLYWLAYTKMSLAEYTMRVAGPLSAWASIFLGLFALAMLWAPWLPQRLGKKGLSWRLNSDESILPFLSMAILTYLVFLVMFKVVNEPYLAQILPLWIVHAIAYRRDVKSYIVTSALFLAFLIVRAPIVRLFSPVLGVDATWLVISESLGIPQLLLYVNLVLFPIGLITSAYLVRLILAWFYEVR